jgi:hypothetical protein
MLSIRRARAYSIAGEATAAYRAVDDAFAVYEANVPVADDGASMYRVNASEVFQAAGSSALSLGDPGRALGSFFDATTHHDPSRVSRSACQTSSRSGYARSFQEEKGPRTIDAP